MVTAIENSSVTPSKPPQLNGLEIMIHARDNDETGQQISANYETRKHMGE